MFVAYTNGKDDRKMGRLLEQTTNCEVIDTGCLTTVAGVTWINNYLESLSDFEKSTVVEEPSSASYTFGDGKTYHSVKRLKIPCSIGTYSASIVTDVVSAEIPLLLSKTAMKKEKMMQDFASDSLIIRGRHIKLGIASTGHYVVNLYR